VLVQFALGMFVIWSGRGAMLTTFHVVNGAAVLATAVLLAVRLGRGSAASTHHLRHPTLSPAMV
jgi:hypothetical protein